MKKPKELFPKGFFRKQRPSITFEEATEVYVCKIVAKLHPTEKDVHQDILDSYNNNLKVYFSTNPHGVYIGEIIGHYKRE